MDDKIVMERFNHQGIDSRAMLATYITRLPVLFLLAAAGAVLGSGLNLLIALTAAREPVYVSETEYYISFTRYDARDVYNDFTWNDALGTNLILGRMMELLGGGYDPNEVKNMMTADILSDVRYLTITVRGQEPAEVEAVKDAVGTALEEFGSAKEEFNSIEKIEDQEIAQEKVQYFVWQAAFLGAVIFAGTGIFVIALTGSMGSVFYTKNDIMKILEIPACGLAFAAGREKRACKLTSRQHRMLEENLKIFLERYSEIMLMDASDGRYARAFLQYVKDNDLADPSGLGVYGMEDGCGSVENTAIMAVIPFGRTYRERITDEIQHAQLRGNSIVAAVLTDVDRNWTRIYYGS